MRKAFVGQTYTTQIRMSEALRERVMRIADEIGDSLNGTLINLIDEALRLRGVGYSFQSSDSSGTSTGPCSDS